ncbi:hypothetical protein FNV43_RR18521 [Rhamnella rubrinervis]|uniref:2'-phosphotransferase n=1 Tax=Rhamnella rubrinervis TaxID=2594499 RepID=A0A8K0E587_9ROSA|nr:hypothetical protein FNV43_RR18521 [Rhamnella rubrinervis]
MWASVSSSSIRILSYCRVLLPRVSATPTLQGIGSPALVFMDNTNNSSSGNSSFVSSARPNGRGGRERDLDMKNDRERSRGRRGGGGGGSSVGKDKIDALGRLMTRILRHMASELNLNVRSDGYVKVHDLLKLNMKTFANIPLKSHTVDDIRSPSITSTLGLAISLLYWDFVYAVTKDSKQRFSLLEENGELLIRANQGHTITAVESERLLKPILSVEEVPEFESILASGLKRMKRLHVHFSCGLPADGEVISGMRRDVNIMIFLDVKKLWKVKFVSSSALKLKVALAYRVKRNEAVHFRQQDNSLNLVTVGNASYNKEERSMAILNAFINFIQVTMPQSNIIILTDPASDLAIRRNRVTVHPIQGEYSRDKLMLQRIRSYIAFLDTRIEELSQRQGRYEQQGTATKFRIYSSEGHPQWPFKGKDFLTRGTQSVYIKVLKFFPNAWGPVSSCLGCEVKSFFDTKRFSKHNLFWKMLVALGVVFTPVLRQLDTARRCWSISWHAFGLRIKETSDAGVLELLHFFFRHFRYVVPHSNEWENKI